MGLRVWMMVTYHPDIPLAVSITPRLEPSDLSIQVAHWRRPYLLPRFGARGNFFFRRLPLAQHGKVHKLRHARLLRQIVAVAVRAPAMPNQQVATLGWDGAYPVLERRQLRMIEVANPIRLHSPRCDALLAQPVQLRQRQRHPFGIERVRPGRVRVPPRPAAFAAVATPPSPPPRTPLFLISRFRSRCTPLRIRDEKPAAANTVAGKADSVLQLTVAHPTFGCYNTPLRRCR